VVSSVAENFEGLQHEVGKVIVGQLEAVEQIFTAILTGGHVLLEGVPGIAKTLIVKTVARTLGASFSRIQFTPDLMPSDVIGTNVFNLATQRFDFHPGPVFADLILADEINRTPPKTQSALLEAMEERQVTVDGDTRPLSEIFTVIATQNPVEYEGTYPLPEAQLDRFLLKVKMGYPTPEEEESVLRRYHAGFDAHDLEKLGVNEVLSLTRVRELREQTTGIQVEDDIFGYVEEVVLESRRSPNVVLGASPRAAVSLLLSAKAHAAIRGRGFVIPDDVKFMAQPVLRHRLILRPESELEGVTTDDEIRNILGRVKVPR
jgi:MoxR-like ATPase